MLLLDAVHASYGAAPVLQGVSLRLEPGQLLALLGRNGSGRSTLLKTIMGFVPAQGQIVWHGTPLLGRPAHQIARLGVGYVSEHRQIFANLTVQQNLQLGLPVQKHRQGWSLQSALARFPVLAERAQTLAGVLSGGEQQILALARSLMAGPGLLLVDEPTEGLSPVWVEQVRHTLQEQLQNGVAVLLVEQKMQLTPQLASQCVVMGQGQTVFAGTPQQLEQNHVVQRDWLML